MPRLDISFLRGKENKLDRALSGVLLLSIIAAIGMLVYTVTTPKVGERFTEFYILGPEGMAQDYPQEVALGEKAAVTLVIVNHQYEEKTYQVEVRIEGEMVTDMEAIALAPGERWEGVVSFAPTRVGEDQKVEFILYMDEEPYFEGQPPFFLC